MPRLRASHLLYKRHDLPESCNISHEGVRVETLRQAIEEAALFRGW